MCVLYCVYVSLYNGCMQLGRSAATQWLLGIHCTVAGHPRPPEGQELAAKEAARNRQVGAPWCRLYRAGLLCPAAVELARRWQSKCGAEGGSDEPAGPAAAELAAWRCRRTCDQAGPDPSPLPVPSPPLELNLPARPSTSRLRSHLLYPFQTQSEPNR